MFYYLSSFYLKNWFWKKVSAIGNLDKLQACLDTYILIAFLLFIMNGWVTSSNTGLCYHLYYLLVHIPTYESIKMGSRNHVLIFRITIVVKTQMQKARELNYWTILSLVLNGQCHYSGDRLELNIVANNMFPFSVADRSNLKLVVY